MIRHGRAQVGEADVFYRESGSATAPALLLLHGYPASSYQFRGLMDQLGDAFHCVAPDLPGFGFTASPPPAEFSYTFDALADVVRRFTEAIGLERYILYVFDWGAPVGFRVAVAHPERVAGLIVQNGNAYKEGLSERMLGLKAYWSDREAVEPRIRAILAPEVLVAQYREGAREPATIAPDAAELDRHFLDQPGRQQAILDLFYDYRTNVEHYPQWQQWLREANPPTLIVWGRNDPFFTVAGAEAYLRDAAQASLHLFDTGHFALQEDGHEIAGLIRDFFLTGQTEDRLAA